jgi:hypothetical protein
MSKQKFLRGEGPRGRLDKFKYSPMQPEMWKRAKAVWPEGGYGLIGCADGYLWFQPIEQDHESPYLVRVSEEEGA